MFGFAIRRQYAVDNPCDRVELPTQERAPIRYLSTDETIRCLQHIAERRPRALAVFVLTTLAGLRPEEAQATTWPSIRLDDPEPHVVVEAQTSKVRQRRIVYPMPAAIAWLREAKRLKAELPLDRQPWRRTIRDLRTVLGWDRWPQDITRHTAATYWLAEIQNASHVAEQLGNSVGVLKTHYRALVSREQAKRFWAIGELLSVDKTARRTRNRPNEHSDRSDHPSEQSADSAPDSAPSPDGASPASARKGLRDSAASL